MSATTRVLLLVGSPKARSTSESLGAYLLGRLAEIGCQTQSLRIGPGLKTPEGQQELLTTIDGADLLVLSCPLYVDGPPAPAMRLMEMLADSRRGTDRPKTQRLLAISNCGFPEVSHNETAVGIYRRFAAEVGFAWAGGLAMGMGGAIDGQPLDQAGSMAWKPRKALDLAAPALAAGEPVPDEAVEMMAKPLMPRWLYTWLGNLNWKRKSKRHGVRRQLGARPYES